MKTKNPFIIYLLGSDPVARFAAQELQRYLRMMGGGIVRLRRASRYDAAAAGCWIGLAADYPDPPVATDGGDDTVFVAAGGGHARLAGANGRAVLYAVYRYLEELGCCWIRPGEGGEHVPRLRRPLHRSVSLLEKPAARHRCICIEGSCSVGHVKAMIDYAAKRGFNGYFTQFRNSYAFFARWYGMERHRRALRTPFSSEKALQCQEQAKAVALRRGLMLYTVGHGWTCEPFGIRGEEWAPARERAPSWVTPYLAQIDGRRELRRGVPLNTQLCYSQKRVRKIVADDVVAYVRAHPHEDYIHVSLADGANNHCECGRCRQAIPSDWYVMLLNEIDAKLTRAGLDNKIVFNAYVDLLWAPEHEELANPDRFLLVFAPITRSYNQPFLAGRKQQPAVIPPYERNRLRFPVAPADNLAMLAEWRKVFAGECVDFDYHLWAAFYADPGQMKLARVIHADASALKKMGMDGFISCQYQRVSFPTGITMEAMGRGLWGVNDSFDTVADRYFQRVFGADGAQVRRYLESISATISDDMLTAPTAMDDKRGFARMRRAARKWSRIDGLVEAMRPYIANGVKKRAPAIALAWRVMEHHAWYVMKYAEFQRLAWSGAPAASELYDAIADELDRRLPLLHGMLDTWAVKRHMQHTLWLNGLPFSERVTLPLQ